MKITKKQLRRIIREAQREINHENFLNEGFFDFFKKMGGKAGSGAKKQQAAAGDYKSAWEEHLAKLGDVDQGEIDKIVSTLKKDVRKARGRIFSNIGNMSALEDDNGQVPSSLQAALLAYIWNDLAKGT